jgi:small GTP-binding protein
MSKISAEVIFAGRSNVGKSTLFSNLFGVDVRKGRKPGTTLKPNSINLKGLQITDLPGYGFMQGVSRDFSEKVKDFIVQYIETNSERILLAIQVIDGKSFMDIVERWEARGEIPIDIEMYQFLNEFNFPVFLAVNKMDRVEKRDYLLNLIAKKMGMIPPWTNWKHKIFPISAKKGETDNIRKAVKRVLVENGFGGILK